MNEENQSNHNFFEIGNVLKHYKGGMYTIVGTCLIEASLKPAVLYKPHQGDSQNVIWMRPMAEFQDQITTENGTVQRFTLVSNGGQALITTKALPALTTSAAAGEKSNARTEAALGRLRRAMQDIEAEILANHGIYPFNYGRLTQSELCRRADVKKATLQNPLHKDTTRVEIMGWLDEINFNLTKTREGTRERVTTVAESLSAQLQVQALAQREAQAQLEIAEKLIEQLKQENASLRNRINM
jgi:hypothetical protein